LEEGREACACLECQLWLGVRVRLHCTQLEMEQLRLLTMSLLRLGLIAADLKFHWFAKSGVIGH
jgi:hypothetical protein